MSVPFREGSGSPPVPDVDNLMERVRANVADELARGVFSGSDLEEVRRSEQELGGCGATALGVADDIARLRATWDPLGPHTFTSHRGGVGKLVVAAKQVLRRLAGPVATVILARQTEFNGAVARLLAGASDGVRSLDNRHDALLRRLDELERRNRELAALCEKLQAAVRGLQVRVDREGDGVSRE